MSAAPLFISENHLRYTPPVNILAVQDTDSQSGTAATVHNLVGVQAGALLVLLTGNQNSAGTPIISDSEGLTWTLREEVHAGGSPNNEIWTATFTAGGDIDVTSNWGATRQTSTIIVVTGHDPVIAGATIDSGATSQATPNLSITTTRANSLIFVNSVNWNAVDGARTYRGLATELHYSDHAESSFFSYMYTPTAAQAYTIGLTAPNDGDEGYSTTAIEIRTGNVGPDTTPPTTPTLSEVNHGTTNVNLSWTASTDNVLLAGYRLYQDGVLIFTQTGTTKNVTGLTASTNYDFTVVAYDASNNTSSTSNEISVTTNAGGGGGGGTDHADITMVAMTDPYPRTGAGHYRWNEKSGSQTVGGLTEPLDDYRRFTWTDLEETTEDNYVWDLFDEKVQDAINAGHTFSFGIMTSFPGSDGVFNRHEEYDGFDERLDVTVSNRTSVYPEYLHNMMQAEADTDWVGTDNDWVPNYNSPSYISRLIALHTALRNHINSTSYEATAGPHIGEVIQFADVIRLVDIRGVGSYGEWHHNGSIPGWPTEAMDYFPDGTFPTEQGFKDIIDAHVDVFTDWPLVIIFNSLDHMTFVNTQVPNEVAQYWLGLENNWGPIGLRDDHIGEYMGYNDAIMKDNNEDYDGTQTIADVVQERWKYNMLMGEPPGPGLHDTGGCGFDLCDFPNQLTHYHYSFVGNGNFESDNPGASTEAMWTTYYPLIGHRIRIEDGTMDLDANDFTIVLNWTNVGNAPTYDDWDVTFELRTGSTVEWSDVSVFNPWSMADQLLPGADQQSTDIFDRPALANGTYELFIKIYDPRNGYRFPLSLAIEGVESDGAYKLCDVVFD